MTTVDFAAAATNADLYALGLPIVNLGAGAQNINGTGARPAAAGGAGMVFRLSTAESTADHYAETPITLASAGAYRESGVLVRTNASGTTGWYVTMDNNAGTTEVRVWDFPAFGAVQHSATVAEGNGSHTLRVEVEGSDLRIYIDGNLKTTWTSATGTDTYAGAGSYVTGGGGALADVAMASISTGSLSSTITGTGTPSQAAQTAAGTGSVTFTPGWKLLQDGSIKLREDGGRKALESGAPASGTTATGSPSQAAQTAAGTGSVTITGSGAAVQAAQTTAGTGHHAIGRWPTTVDAGIVSWRDQNGEQLFLVGDTAWSLFGQLNATDTTTYLTDIAAKGARLVLASGPEPWFTDNTPAYRNANGDDPFVGVAFQSAANPAYFDHVAAAVATALDLGTTFAICPQYLGANDSEGWRDELTTAWTTNPTAVTEYGKFLARRFGGFPNIVWVIGHDMATLTTETRDASEAIAAELSAGTSHLILPGSARGSAGSGTWSTSTVAYDLDTIYFDNATPGEDTAAVIAANGAAIWIEGYYEQEHTDGIGDLTFREQMWEPFCAGACAVIFGNNPRWHFQSGKELYGFTGTWQQSITDNAFNAGTRHMSHLAAFIDTFPWEGSTPDTTATFLTAGTGFARFSTSIGIVYSSAAASLTLDTTELAGTGNVRIRRYDPTTGTWAAGGAALDVTEAQNAARAITHPGNNAAGAPDWVYVVELASATSGTGTPSQGPQTATGAGSVTFTATGTPVQAAQSSTGTGAEQIGGSGASSQGPQTATGAGSEQIAGSGAPSQAAQTSTSTTSVTYTGAGTQVQGPQTATGAGSEQIGGSGASSQAAQTAAGAGTAGSTIGGNGAPAQAAQTAAGSGSVTYTGAGAALQAAHMSTGAGIESVTGTGSPSQAAHTAAGSGSAGSAITGTGSPSQAAQTAAGTGSVTFTAAGAALQAAQTSTGVALELITGTGTPAQAAQIAAGVGTAAIPATGSGTPVQAPQTAAGVGTVGALTFTGEPCTLTVSDDARTITVVSTTARTITVVDTPRTLEVTP